MMIQREVNAVQDESQCAPTDRQGSSSVKEEDKREEDNPEGGRLCWSLDRGRKAFESTWRPGVRHIYYPQFCAITLSFRR